MRGDVVEINIRNNSFNFIRMFAALQVLILHANTHLELSMGKTEKLLGIFSGVPIFFCISGYLITYSLRNSHSIKEYFRKRILRIYPELWGGVLVSTFFILVFYEETINISQLVFFNITQSTFMQFYTPDFLRGYGVGTPNGSLWTITVTVQFYIVFYFVHSILKKQKKTTWIGIILFFVVVNILTFNLDSFLPLVVYKLYLQTVIPYFYMFLIGSFVYNFREKTIPILTKYFYVLLIIFIVVSYFNLGLVGVYVKPLKGIFLSLLAIAFAYKFNKIKVNLDLSYGIYIYHMIVINVFVELGLTGSLITLLNVTALSCLLAYASYKLIVVPNNKVAAKRKLTAD